MGVMCTRRSLYIARMFSVYIAYPCSLEGVAVREISRVNLNVQTCRHRGSLGYVLWSSLCHARPSSYISVDSFTDSPATVIATRLNHYNHRCGDMECGVKARLRDQTGHIRLGL
jgi:hypothetical protein